MYLALSNKMINFYKKKQKRILSQKIKLLFKKKWNDKNTNVPRAYN